MPPPLGEPYFHSVKLSAYGKIGETLTIVGSSIFNNNGYPGLGFGGSGPPWSESSDTPGSAAFRIFNGSAWVYSGLAATAASSPVTYGWGSWPFSTLGITQGKAIAASGAWTATFPAAPAPPEEPTVGSVALGVCVIYSDTLPDPYWIDAEGHLVPYPGVTYVDYEDDLVPGDFAVDPSIDGGSPPSGIMTITLDTPAFAISALVFNPASTGAAIPLELIVPGSLTPSSGEASASATALYWGLHRIDIKPRSED